MKAFRWIWLLATLAVLANGLRVSLFVVPTDALQGDMYRIFYYHLPAWWVMSVFFALNLGGSITYLVLRNRNPQRALRADTLAAAGAEMGVVFCTVGLVTGSLWGRAAWGIWWTWDERLTSTLILWLIYLAYLLLRRFADGPPMRTLSAVVAIFGYLDTPLVYMSTRWWRTQHPGPVIFGGPNAGLDASMWPAIWWNFAGWLMWALFVFGLRYRTVLRQQLASERAALALLSEFKSPSEDAVAHGGLSAGGRA